MTTANQTQPASASPQPVAAAIVVSAAADTAPTPGNAAASGTTIGGSAKARAKLALPSLGEPNTAEGAAKDTATAKTTPAANSANSATNPSTDPSSATTAAGDPQQGPAPTDTAVPAQPNGNAAANSASAAPRIEGLASTAAPGSAGSSDAATASGGTKTETAGLPNFGFTAANAPAAAAAVATPATTAGSVPVAGLAVAIASRAQAGSNQFDIRLDPPELGRIDVRLDVDSDGHVTSHITVDRADTLQLLQNQQPQLERALTQAGLNTADNGMQFTLRDQSFAGQNNNGGGTQSNVAQLVIPDADLAPIQATQIYSRLGVGSGIDIRV